MDKIKIKNLHIYAYHGVHDEEKEKGQNFYINAVIYLDAYVAGQTDALEDTVSYSDVCKLFNKAFVENKFDLIETAAEYLAKQALISFSAIRKIEVEVSKPEAPIGLPVENVSVDITRGWSVAYLSIGSNIGDKKGYIDKAIALLSRTEEIRVLTVSDMIITKPYGGVEQDDFLNGAIKIETLLPPKALLDRIHEIEAECGRERLIHWGPRTLDIDILLYENEIIFSKDLIIPHPDMENRGFVLEPLNQIAPNTVHPVLGKSVKALFLEL